MGGEIKKVMGAVNKGVCEESDQRECSSEVKVKQGEAEVTRTLQFILPTSYGLNQTF